MAAQFTVRRAAQILGISEGAVRSRIHRGTLPTRKIRGRIFVLLAEDLTAQEAHNPDPPIYTPVYTPPGAPPEAPPSAPESPIPPQPGSIPSEAFQAVLEAHRREVEVLREMVEIQDRRHREDMEKLRADHRDQVERLDRIVLMQDARMNAMQHLLDRTADRVRPLREGYRVNEIYRA